MVILLYIHPNQLSFLIKEQIYNLQKRIDDSDKMISSLLEKLSLIDFPDQNNIIKKVQKKKIWSKKIK